MRRARVVFLLLLSFSAGASTYTVDDAGDAGDANLGDDICDTGGGFCTLRAALQEANAHSGADTIAFDIAGVIAPATALPSITDQITIDGTSAPGYTNAPEVVIEGAPTVGIGLHFDLGSENSELIALTIYGFSTAGVRADADAVTIRRNYIGPIPEGAPNFDGLQLNGNGSTVGGEDGEGNVISGNDQHGIAVSGVNHDIRDNFIGVDETGADNFSNGDDGISVIGSSLTIGSATAGEENVISANFDVGVSIDGGTGTVGAAPVISFSQATYTVPEALVSVTVLIPVTRSGDLDAISTVDYATSNNTATAGSDYTTATGTLTFAAGDDRENFAVTVTNDTTDEPVEIVNLTLSNPTKATLTEPFTAQLTITDDDPETITIDDDAENEGTTLTFTLRLSNARSSDTVVTYTTADDTATAGVDYTAQTSFATIPAGSLTTTINILTSADGTTEPDETFFVKLIDATTLTRIADNQGVGTISNDDAQPTVSIDDDAENEGDTLTFTLTLSNLSASDVTVNYTTADNTANAGTDYTAQTNVATIAAGNLSTTINVPTADDAGDEPDETFFLNLTAAANATIIDNQGLGTITDNDAPMADLTITKTAAAPTFTLGDQVTFTITVQNLGPAPATLLTVTDVLPAGTTLVSATGPDATCNGTTTISCTIPTLANGASTTITLIVTANTAAPIANTASVAAASPADPTPLNDAATATVSPTGIDEVPTVTEWGLLLLAFALGVIAMRST